MSKHVAVHFGNFYGIRDNVQKTRCNNRESNFRGVERTAAAAAAAAEGKRRSEFTRQMVHK